MNLDDLIAEIRGTSADPVVQGIADQLAAWKTSSDTSDELAAGIERYIGQTWIASRQVHERVYALWSAFRRESIETIHGMTMNERLYSFGLYDQFYALQKDSDKQAFYTKLHAGEA